MDSEKKRGFASLSPEQRKLVSSKGGRVTGKKGTAVLSEGERKERASQAAKARWKAYKERKLITEEEIRKQLNEQLDYPPENQLS